MTGYERDMGNRCLRSREMRGDNGPFGQANHANTCERLKLIVHGRRNQIDRMCPVFQAMLTSESLGAVTLLPSIGLTGMGLLHDQHMMSFT